MELSKGPFIVLTHPSLLHPSLFVFGFSLQITQSHVLLTFFPFSSTEAVDIFKEMKEKEVVIDDSHVTMLFHVLNVLAVKGDSEPIRKLQDTIFTLGLAKPSANLCSPLVTSYLNR